MVRFSTWYMHSWILSDAQPETQWIGWTGCLFILWYMDLHGSKDGDIIDIDGVYVLSFSIEGDMELVNIVCVYYGLKYSIDYVQVLYNMVQRNITVPHIDLFVLQTT